MPLLCGGTTEAKDANEEVQKICDERMYPVRGGTSKEKDTNEEVQKICDEMKPHAEEKAGRPFDVFTAKSYKTQVVAGTNYFIKVDVGGEECIHVRVYKMLPCDGEKLELHGIQTQKTHQDEIEYF